MVKKPQSEPRPDNSELTGKDAKNVERPSVEQPPTQEQDDRIADLERRIAELSEHLPVETIAPSASSPLDALLLEQQNERIVELQRLIANLAERMATVQAVNARDEQFNAAVRSVESAASAVQRSLAPVAMPSGSAHLPAAAHPSKRECGCEPCECVSCECCTFEVWLTHVRVDQMQNPLIDLLPPSADSNVLPTGMMEVWMFASIDPVHNLGRCFPDPSPTSYIPLNKQLTDPIGPWSSVNGCVGTVTVKKGVPQTFPLTLTVVEREDTAERLQPMNRDEWGRATQDLTLDCCCSTYPPIQISVGLTNGGQAGGAVTCQFMIVKRC